MKEPPLHGQPLPGVSILDGASYLASDDTWTGYEPDTGGLGYHNLVSALVGSQGDVWFGNTLDLLLR